MKILLPVTMVLIIIASGCVSELNNDVNNQSEFTCEVVDGKCCFGNVCSEHVNVICGGNVSELNDCDENCEPIFKCGETRYGPDCVQDGEACCRFNSCEMFNYTCPDAIWKKFVGCNEDCHISSNCTYADDEPDPPEPEKNAYSHLPECGDKMDFYTVLPLNPNDFTSIFPLGNLGPSDHTFPTDHMYFILQGADQYNLDTRFTAYSPGDVWLESVVEHATRGPDDPEDFFSYDYSLKFWMCKNVSGMFRHMISISDRIKENLGEVVQECHGYEINGAYIRDCEYKPQIWLSAGEIIGEASLSTGCCLDMWTTDYRLEPLDYINKEIWGPGVREVALYYRCSADYFTADLKEQLYSKFGYINKRRTIEPICGEIEQDEPGTAQGVWYWKDRGEKLQTGGGLALVHDNIDPTIGAFSFGTKMDGVPDQDGLYHFLPKNTGSVNRDFDQVLPGDVYCYETYLAHDPDKKAAFIIELISSTELRIEKYTQTTCGSGSWIFTNPTEFER
jgi:hypothetical protein